MSGFSPRFFLVVVTWLTDVTEGHLTPSGFSWVYPCATGSCATPVVTEGHVTPSEVSLGCSLWRPRLIFSMVTGTNYPRPLFSMVTGTNHPRPMFSMVTGTSLGYLLILFSYSVYNGVSVLTVVFLRVKW